MMKRFGICTTCCAAIGLLLPVAAPAQELGPDSFATGFEPEAGYVAGETVPGQPGDFPEEWFSWYGTDPNGFPLWDAEVTTEQVHEGSQAVVFPYEFTDLQHMGMMVEDPNRLEPVVWEEHFSVYVSSSRANGYPALRSEPWNYAQGYAYAYQLFLWQNGGDGFISDFELYELGALPGQFGWYSWYGDEEAEVSTAIAHSGTQAIAFPMTHTDIQRAVVNGNPDLGPMTWEENFSVYVPGSIPDGGEILRSEPWNNWDGGWSYQFFLYRINDGFTDGWTPVIGWGGLENDLRDEMGMDPNSAPPNSFATDTWWNVTLVADGEAGRVTSVRIADDDGAVYEAAGLSEPFSTWGNDLTDNDPEGEIFASRPERVFYQSGSGGVYLDDISMSESGVPIERGWFPELGWEVNDLRDEMGMTEDEFFAPDKWWNVKIIADGESGTVTTVSISDDYGAQYGANDLSEPFSTWGTPIEPGEWALRPEYITYSGEGGGVYIDDVSVGLVIDCPGDIDGDSDTDLADLAELLGAYGSVLGDPDYNPDADLDNDQDVDLADLAELLGDYGCPS